MFRLLFSSFTILFMLALTPVNVLSLSQSDLAGDWYIYGVASGDSGTGSEEPRWERINFGIDTSGNNTAGTIVDSSGVSEIIPAGEVTINLSPSGIMTNPSYPEEHGVLNEDANLFAYTHTDDGYNLKVGIKRERDSGTSPFNVSELAGDWRGCNVTTGDGTGYRLGYGDMTFDASGNMSGTWTYFISGVTSATTIGGAFSVDADGIISLLGNTTFHGVLSDDANLITFEMTGPGGYFLYFLMRDNSPSSFDLADIQGTWTTHAVVAGDRPDEDPTWMYSTMIFDDAGNFNATGTDPGGTGTFFGTVNLDPDGFVTVSGETVYGFMSDDRDLFAVISQYDDGNELAIGIRGGTSNIAGGIIVNPGFETGDLFGWTAVTTISANWIGVLGSGTTTTPLSGVTNIPAPPEGSFAAVRDCSGEGNSFLYQDFDVPTGFTTISLSATVYVENLHTDYIDGPAFDYSGVTNQKVRLDLMDPTAPIDDTGTGVLENMFITNPGDSNSIPPTVVSVDLSPYAGQTVRLRLGAVDNMLYLVAGLDDIQITLVAPPGSGGGGGGGGCFISTIHP